MSPIISDTVLDRDSQTEKKTNNIGNHLIKIAICKLHNNLNKSNNEG